MSRNVGIRTHDSQDHQGLDSMHTSGETRASVPRNRLSLGQFLIGADDGQMMAPVVKNSLFEKMVEMALVEETRNEAKETNSSITKRSRMCLQHAIDARKTGAQVSPSGPNAITALSGCLRTIRTHRYVMVRWESHRSSTSTQQKPFHFGLSSIGSGGPVTPKCPRCCFTGIFMLLCSRAFLVLLFFVSYCKALTLHPFFLPFLSV